MLQRQFQRPEVLGINLPQPKLKIALGMTCSGVNTLSVDTNTGILAYPASGVVVLFDTNENRQIQYISQPRKTVSCVSFSPDGKLLLIGENGNKPSLYVWNIAQRKSVADFHDHGDGIKCAKFSNSMDIIASVGGKHDCWICVRAWPSQFKLASNRFSESLFTMSFSSKCLTFVTCGSRHIKFWYPKKDTPSKAISIPQAPRVSTLFGRRAILGSHKNSTFADVAWSSSKSGDHVYTVTSNGVILKISAVNRSVMRSMCLQNKKLSSIQVHDKDIFVGTSNGCVIILDDITLKPIRSLMSPLDISYAEQVFENPEDTEKQTLMKDDTDDVYLALDHINCRVIAALTNSSLCIWDIKDSNDIKKTHYSVGHSKGISDMDLMSPRLHNSSPWPGPDTTEQETIVTVSHDSTVRLWKMFMSGSIYCESSKTIYTDLERSPPYSATDNDAKVDTCTEPRMITAAKVSQENDLITAGDNKGLITVYDAETLTNVNVLQKHTRTVTTLCFFSGNGDIHRLLISSSKDRLINIFNVDAGFALLNTLKFHSGSVTTVGVCGTPERIMLISASVDRSVVLCGCQWDRTHDFRLFSSFTTPSAVVDIVINQKDHHVAVGRYNGEISILDVQRLKLVQRINTCYAEHVHLERLHLDHDARLLLGAFSNRSINILSYPRGINLASVNSICRDVIRLRFSSNTRCIVSSSADGCIFVWSIPSKIIRAGTILKSIWETSEAKKAQQKSPRQQKKMAEVISHRMRRRVAIKYVKQKEIKESVLFEPVSLKREKTQPSPICVKDEEHSEDKRDTTSYERYSHTASVGGNLPDKEEDAHENGIAHTSCILKSQSFTVPAYIANENRPSHDIPEPIVIHNKHIDPSCRCEKTDQEEDLTLKGDTTLMNSLQTNSSTKETDHTLIEGLHNLSSASSSSSSHCHLNEACADSRITLGYSDVFSKQNLVHNDEHIFFGDASSTEMVDQHAMEKNTAEIELCEHDVKTPDRIYGREDTASEASVASGRSSFSNKVWNSQLPTYDGYAYHPLDSQFSKRTVNDSTTNGEVVYDFSLDYLEQDYPLNDSHDELTESLNSSPSPDFRWENDDNMQVQYFVDDAPPPVHDINSFNMRIQPGMALPYVASDPCNRIQSKNEYGNVDQNCELIEGQFYPKYQLPNMFGSWQPSTFCREQRESYEQTYNYGEVWQSSWREPEQYYQEDIDAIFKPIKRDSTVGTSGDFKPNNIPHANNNNNTNRVPKKASIQ